MIITICNLQTNERWLLHSRPQEFTMLSSENAHNVQFMKRLLWLNVNAVLLLSILTRNKIGVSNQKKTKAICINLSIKWLTMQCHFLIFTIKCSYNFQFQSIILCENFTIRAASTTTVTPSKCIDFCAKQTCLIETLLRQPILTKKNLCYLMFDLIWLVDLFNCASLLWSHWA